MTRTPTHHPHLAPRPPADAPRIDSETGAAIITAYGQTIQPYTQARKTYIPMVCDLIDARVETAVELATTLIEKLNLYPGEPAEITDVFGEIADWARLHGHAYLLDLLGPVAEELICDLVGIPDLTFVPVERPKTRGRVTAVTEEDERAALARVALDRDRAHLVRNALIALRSAVVLSHSRSRKLRHCKDSLALGLRTLPSRVGKKSRPLTDDEVLLCRFLVEIDLKERAAPRPTLAYLVGETGITCQAGTLLKTSDLDQRYRPTKVDATGAWDFADRGLPLTDYVQQTIPRLLRRLRQPTDTLTYNGREPGTKAAHASVGAQLKRHLVRAGLDDPDLTPKSINRWRAMHALLQGEDFANVVRYHGGAAINVTEQLKLEIDTSDVSEGWITLVEKTEAPAQIRIPRAEFTRDRSITLKGNRRKKPVVELHCGCCAGHGAA